MGKLIVPALRGRIGDWIYYVGLMKFQEIGARIKLAKEIHPNEELHKLIQREITDRSSQITDYIFNQKERFFNSIIVGLYDGSPDWKPLQLNSLIDDMNEADENEIGKTLGVLTLDGNEKLFAIDGQHRVVGVKGACEVAKEKKKLEVLDDEVPVIFVAHKTNDIGVQRTRRLFTTLNRYAKPVSKSEIIALDEEDNSAVITRNLLFTNDKLRGAVLISKSKSMPPSDKKLFTNLITFHEIVEVLCTDKRFIKSIPVKGREHKSFSNLRLPDSEIKKVEKELVSKINKIIEETLILKKYFRDGIADRSKLSSSLLFRPVGQLIFFNLIKISLDSGSRAFFNEVINYFNSNRFDFTNPDWKKILFDQNSKRIKPHRENQALGVVYVLNKIGKHELSESEKKKFKSLKILTKQKVK